MSYDKHQVPLLLACLLCMATVPAWGQPWDGATVWSGSGGDWFDENGWSPAPPDSGSYEARIDNGSNSTSYSGPHINGLNPVNNGSADAYRIRVGWSAGGGGYLSMSAGELMTEGLYIGHSLGGWGGFNMTGGELEVGKVALDYTGPIVVGERGDGEFSASNGSIIRAGAITLAAQSFVEAEVSLNNTDLEASNLIVGEWGRGTLYHGHMTDATIGTLIVRNGSYRTDLNGYLATTTTEVRDTTLGNPAVFENGAIHETGTLYVGGVEESVYKQHGDLDADEVWVGYNGHGMMTQNLNGSSTSITDDLIIGAGGVAECVGEYRYHSLDQIPSTLNVGGKIQIGGTAPNYSQHGRGRFELYNFGFQHLFGNISAGSIEVGEGGTLALGVDIGNLGNLITNSSITGLDQPGRILEITLNKTVSQGIAPITLDGLRVGSSDGDATYVAEEDMTSSQLLIGEAGSDGIYEHRQGDTTTDYLYIGPNATYEYTGATAGEKLTIHGGMDAYGTLQVVGTGNHLIVDVPGCIVNLGNATIISGSRMSMSVGPDSLLILPPGGDPFSSLTNEGITHIAGNTLVVAAGEGFDGVGSIDDPVECAGWIHAYPGGFINLNGGVTVSGTGEVLLGAGQVIADSASGISGGQLSADVQYVGHTGTGTFTHTGGTNTVAGELCIGKMPGADGTYTISDGTLIVADLVVGGDGAGALNIVSTEVDEITVSNRLHFGPGGSLSAVPGTSINMTGSQFENESTDPSALADLINVELIYAQPQMQQDFFEAAGADIGPTPAGFIDNFALGELTMEIGTILTLVDLIENQGGADEALYVYELNLGEWTMVDLNGVNLYYMVDSIDPSAMVMDMSGQGGMLIQVPVPEPSTVVLLCVGMVLLAIRLRRTRRTAA